METYRIKKTAELTVQGRKKLFIVNTEYKYDIFIKVYRHLFTYSEVIPEPVQVVLDFGDSTLPNNIHELDLNKIYIEDTSI